MNRHACLVFHEVRQQFALRFSRLISGGSAGESVAPGLAIV
jgi:hypothetical protein